MKKVIILFSILFLVSCTNYNSIENTVHGSNIYYCYKEYDNYEEYIKIEYVEDNIENIYYSYVFDNDISKKINKLNEYKDYIKYRENTLEIFFEDIDINIYIKLKELIINSFNLKEDKFDYIINDKIKMSLFNEYLEGYSCE